MNLWKTGKVVFASGTQFPAIQESSPEGAQHGRELLPAQVNNCFVFPGVGLGTLLSEAKVVDDAMLLAAAGAVAALVTDKNLDKECILPDVDQLGETTLFVASAVLQASPHPSGKRGRAEMTTEELKALMYVAADTA
eukprot:gene26409-17507_t